jgi:hypothetical protein
MASNSALSIGLIVLGSDSAAISNASRPGKPCRRLTHKVAIAEIPCSTIEQRTISPRLTCENGSCVPNGTCQECDANNCEVPGFDTETGQLVCLSKCGPGIECRGVFVWLKIANRRKHAPMERAVAPYLITVCSVALMDILAVHVPTALYAPIGVVLPSVQSKLLRQCLLFWSVRARPVRQPWPLSRIISHSCCATSCQPLYIAA